MDKFYPRNEKSFKNLENLHKQSFGLLILVFKNLKTTFSRALQIGLNFVHLHSADGQTKENQTEKNERLKQREKEIMNKLKSRDVYNANEYSVNLDKSNIEKALEEQKAKVKIEKPKPEFNADDFLDTRLKDQTKPGTPSSLGCFFVN